MKNRILISAIIFTIAIFAAHREASAFSINISPPSIHISVPPGGAKSGAITVENKSDDPMDVKAYIEDWVYTADGGKTFKPAGTTPLSCAKWITINPQKFHLEPKGKLGVQYTISVPQDAEGGHYAVIFFESALNEAEATEGNVVVRFSGRIGSIIYQETEGKVNKVGSITSFTSGRPDQNNPLEFKITLKNEGNTHILANGILNIMDKDGNVLGKKEFGPINTLSGETRECKAEWLGELPEGTYDAIATLDIGGGAPLVAETVLTVSSSGAIDKIDVDSGTNRPAFNVIVNNTGNLNVKAEGRVDILDRTGAVLQTVPLKKALIAPNTQKGMEAKADAPLAPGNYKAKAVVMFGDKELIKEGDFTIK